MKKGFLKNKLTEFALNSDSYKKSWAVHEEAFAPILKPAFVENDQARIQLTAALNKISRRDIDGGLKLLKKMEKECVTDADKAAWLYFSGLCFELEGEIEGMIFFYREAKEFGHHFYLPNLKVAKQAHKDAIFDMAEEYYMEAIRCFDVKNGELDEKDTIILASAYSNLASCLTMMQRYEEAENALERSKQALKYQSGREATEAILCAAKGDKEGAEKALKLLKDEGHVFLQETQKMVDEILNGTHPQFYRQEVDLEAIDVFWNWFLETQDTLCELLNGQRYEEVIELLQRALVSVAPFMKRLPELAIEPEEVCVISFADFYMVGLSDLYDRLIQKCPKEIIEAGEFKFEIVH